MLTTWCRSYELTTLNEVCLERLGSSRVEGVLVPVTGGDKDPTKTAGTLKPPLTLYNQHSNQCAVHTISEPSERIVTRIQRYIPRGYIQRLQVRGIIVETRGTLLGPP
eukprot:scaffold52129_cov58-Phaeocystis_antarctica.AAC.2